MNTKKMLGIRERAYNAGSLRTNINFTKRSTPEIDGAVYHIRLQSKIEKSYDIEERENYRKVDAKKSIGINEFGPLSQKSEIVRKCFDSTSVRGCLTQKVNTQNTKYNTIDFNNESNFKCNNIHPSIIKEYTKNYYKKSNLNNFSQKMKESLLSPYSKTQL
jgi:hypothetical protein